MDVIVATAPEPVRGARRVPASKSLHQRALLLAALSERETRLEGSASTPAGDDVRRLGAALEALGPRWVDGALGASRQRVAVDLGLGATGFRYAMAAASLRPAGAVTLVRGRPPLLARPHAVLRRALDALGGHVKRRHSGAMRVLGGGVRGRPLSVASDISSQYASALLLIAPRIGGLELTLPDRPVSRPYLALTIQVLQAFGVPVEVEGLDGPGGRITVAAAAPALEVFSVEADASCAAPWWAAAALTGGRRGSRASRPGPPRRTRRCCRSWSGWAPRWSRGPTAPRGSGGRPTSERRARWTSSMPRISSRWWASWPLRPTG